ncbi:unnamed protein product [Calypogeia fissa]
MVVMLLLLAELLLQLLQRKTTTAAASTVGPLGRMVVWFAGSEEEEEEGGGWEGAEGSRTAWVTLERKRRTGHKEEVHPQSSLSFCSLVRPTARQRKASSSKLFDTLLELEVLDYCRRSGDGVARAG